MSLKEYAPVPLEDEREDEPEDLSPLGYYSRVRRRGIRLTPDRISRDSQSSDLSEYRVGMS